MKQKIPMKYRWDHPQWGCQYRWGRLRIVFFDQWSLKLRHLTAKNLSPSTTVVRIHDGVPVEEYAMSYAGCHGSPLITRMAHFSVTCKWHRAHRMLAMW